MEIREQRTLRRVRDVFDLIGRREQIEHMAHAMRAIAHPLRLKILCVLGEQESIVQDIVGAVGTTQSNVSQHLAILREEGILGTRRDGNRVYYCVRDQRTLQLIATMREVPCGGAPGS
jgi:ArsR family transcriptional regulator